MARANVACGYSRCTFVDPSRLQDAKKDARVAFHATNAWDKVGTLKSIGLWDERVDVALRENTARHKLAHRQRVKAVAYVPEIDSQPQTFLQFDVKEDFVLAGFYGLAMVAKKSGREMVAPRPPCASKWIRYFTDQRRWLEKPYKFRKCTHPFCDEWKIVPVLRKNFNEHERNARKWIYRRNIGAKFKASRLLTKTRIGTRKKISLGERM